MSQSPKFAERIYVTVPSSGIINYQDYLPETPNSSLSNSPKSSFQTILQDIVTRVETYGITSKSYKLDPDDETSSYLSSFILNESDFSSFSSQSFIDAEEQGFYVLNASDFPNELKRKRTSDHLESLIREIQFYFDNRKGKYITIEALEMFRAVEKLIESFPETKQGEVFKRIQEVTKIKVSEIKKQLEIDTLKREKKRKEQKFYFCRNALKGQENNESEPEGLLKKLEVIVDLHNKISSLSNKPKDFLTLESAKMKYLNQSLKLTQRKSAQYSFSGLGTEDSLSSHSESKPTELDPDKILNN